MKDFFRKGGDTYMKGKLNIWEKIAYVLMVIFSLGGVWLYKVIIKKAIVDAMGTE